MNIQEVAPPTKKHERMVKHIKKSYKKDGKLTDDEKSIAYATAWKNYNKEDWKPEIEVIDTKKEAKKREKKRKEAESSLPPHLRLDAMKQAFAHTNESAVLDANTKIKNKEDRKKKEKEYAKLMSILAHRKKMKEMGLGEGKDLNPSVEIAKMRLEKKKKEDAKKKKAKALAKSKQRATGALKKHDSDGDGYVRVIDAGYKPEGEVVQDSFEIDKAAHKKVQKKAKLRNLAKGNMNPNEKAAAEKKAGGPKLAFEGWQDKAKEAMRKVAGKKPPKKHDYGRDAGKVARELMRKKDHQTVNFLDPDD